MKSISVLMPVRNGIPFLVEALESLEAQSVPADEVVIVLNSTTDSSRDVISQSRLPIVLVESSSTNLGELLNYGLSHCSGELIARMDADDRCKPNRFEVQVEQFRSRESLQVLGSAYDRIDVAGRTLAGPRRKTLTGPREVARGLVRRNSVAHSSVMMRRSFILGIGGYSAHARWIEDYELWMRVGCQGEIDNVSQALIEYRTHPKQSSKLQVLDQDLRRLILRRKLELARHVGISSSTTRMIHLAWLFNRRFRVRGVGAWKFAIGHRQTRSPAQKTG